jgi:hypothetical protein
MNNLLENSEMCICKQCGCEMIGYPGDDQCSDCFMGIDREAMNRQFENEHFERTGERKTTGEILRNALGM